ncbi:citXG protein [Erysipelothrix larvae]|uniref:citrate lyase holo-[acyl-carrier protein] synthase n=1 Tax=Erysipelothrix larvae TaxID=1514105 RepID=A0A120JTQ0_9FIRM|nr:triphosphoribosyl-dephospho-CoA synthase [Erysipelothrix larvae]AMC93525.1 citXG protein [Erysipelothrix larvae]
MKIVPLTSDSFEELRKERREIVKSMVEDKHGSLLVLSGAFAGSDRQNHNVSYAVFTVFFELWDRYTFESWSYTFDADGLIFYVRLEEDAESVRNTMVHYEDNHPIGFAIHAEVYDYTGEVTREAVGANERLDFYYKMPIDELLNNTFTEKKYEDTYIKNVENQVVSGDKHTVLSNILVYGFVSVFTKPMGFGMYGPNYRGSNTQMNFEKFVHWLRTYKDEMKRAFNINIKNAEEVRRFQQEVEMKIKAAVLNQQSYQYPVYMTSVVLLSFIHARGYQDMQSEIKRVSDSLYGSVRSLDEHKRYDIARTGMKEVFSLYVPFYQRNKSIMSTLLYIMSRYDDQAVLRHNGEQNLLKVQFLAKNLIMKEDKWIEMDRFCTSNYIYPHDSTVLLAVTVMLDIIQRYYLKIRILFERSIS